MSLRTPLARVRGLGPAKEGVQHWWVQRTTAAALVPLTVWFVIAVLSMIGADHATFTAWLAAPLPAVLMILFIIAGFHHMRLGVQVVIEDYVHHATAKVVLQVLLVAFTYMLGLASILAVLRIALGG